MKRVLSAFVMLFSSLLLRAETIRLDGVDFHCRVPGHHDANSGIMVLFGGRNWPGDKTLATFRFDLLADKHRLFLLSPSFQDRNYWEPEPWSGKLLKQAIQELQRKYRLKNTKLFFYGYSAGGQCVTLFYQWMPDQVAAWGIHGCGVFPPKLKTSAAPALITCGTEDSERLQISRSFVYRYREHGGELLWKYYRNSGHELTPAALELAKVWFDDLLSERKILCYGEDDTFQIQKMIDVEFRNPLYSERLKDLWKK